MGMSEREGVNKIFVVSRQTCVVRAQVCSL